MVLIESHEENPDRVDWIISFTCSNQTKDECIVAKSYDDAISIIESLRRVEDKLDQLLAIRSGNSISGNNKLVTALLECDTITNNLETLKGDLPSKIRDKMSNSSSNLIQVVELVRACNQYEAIDDLIEALRFYEKDSLPFREVERIIR